MFKSHGFKGQELDVSWSSGDQLFLQSVLDDSWLGVQEQKDKDTDKDEAKEKEIAAGFNPDFSDRDAFRMNLVDPALIKTMAVSPSSC